MSTYHHLDTSKRHRRISKFRMSVLASDVSVSRACSEVGSRELARTDMKLHTSNIAMKAVDVRSVADEQMID